MTDWDEIYWGQQREVQPIEEDQGSENLRFHTGGLIGDAPQAFVPGGCVIPGLPYVGDTTPYEYGMYWDPISRRWVGPSTLTYPTSDTTVYPVAKTEVIEFTDEFDVDSSSIKHVWYNSDTERMTVEFKTGGLYSYDGVPAALVQEFVNSDSLGQFFAVTFNRHGDEKWPGAKHNIRTTQFVAVEPEPKHIEPDPDAFKVDLVTKGHGKPFRLHFTYEAEDDMTVRAADVPEAIAAFEKYAAEKGYKAKVTGVFIDLT